MANPVQLERARPRLRLTISRAKWDRSKALRQTFTVVFLLSSLGAAGNWYNWLSGDSSLSFPAVLTVIAVVALAVTPRRWQLLVLSAGAMLGLEIVAVVLHRGPEGLLLKATAVTAAVAGVLQYVRTKVERPRADSDEPGPGGPPSGPLN